jgi:hypothetical protein
VKELANNSQAAMLTPAQATDALAALERLADFQQTTERKVSLLRCSPNTVKPPPNFTGGL